MGLRQRVKEAIINEYPETLTNQQLAYRLGENEPSVRRVTLALSNSGHILETSGGYAGLPIQWRAIAADVVDTADITAAQAQG